MYFLVFHISHNIHTTAGDLQCNVFVCNVQNVAKMSKIQETEDLCNICLDDFPAEVVSCHHITVM